MNRTPNEFVEPVMLRSLRPVSLDDLGAVHGALQNHDLVRWLGALPLNVDWETSRKYLEFLLDPEVESAAICLGDRLVGTVSNGLELSFWLEPRLHRRGLGNWAISTFIERLPSHCHTITACCMIDNFAASAVLGQIGFQRDNLPLRRFSFVHEHSVPMWRHTLKRFPEI